MKAPLGAGAYTALTKLMHALHRSILYELVLIKERTTWLKLQCSYVQHDCALYGLCDKT